MALHHREIAFEDAIEHHLLGEAGYARADPKNFDRERAVDRLGESGAALISAVAAGKIGILGDVQNQ